MTEFCARTSTVRKFSKTTRVISRCIILITIQRGAAIPEQAVGLSAVDQIQIKITVLIRITPGDTPPRAGICNPDTGGNICKRLAKNGERHHKNNPGQPDDMKKAISHFN